MTGEDIVSALAYSLAHSQGGTDQPEFGPPYNDLTQFILRQQARLPDYLRFPMTGATAGFDLLGLLRTGRLLHRGKPSIRARQIASWKHSKLSFQRDLLRYYESLTAVALYS